MKLQVKVNPETGVIDDAKFKTFGCGSAIASSSLATEWLKGKTVDEALAIKNTDIVNELSLPPVKIHCSVLAEDAIKAAIADYKKKQSATSGVSVGPLFVEPVDLQLDQFIDRGVGEAARFHLLNERRIHTVDAHRH